MLSSPARCQSASSNPSALFTRRNYIVPSGDTVFKKLCKTFTTLLSSRCWCLAQIKPSYMLWLPLSPANSALRAQHYRSTQIRKKPARQILWEEREESEWTMCTFLSFSLSLEFSSRTEWSWISKTLNGQRMSWVVLNLGRHELFVTPSWRHGIESFLGNIASKDSIVKPFNLSPDPLGKPILGSSRRIYQSLITLSILTVNIWYIEATDRSTTLLWSFLRLM